MAIIIWLIQHNYIRPSMQVKKTESTQWAWLYKYNIRRIIMAKQIKLIQERPNTGVAWFDAADEFKNLKVSYVNDGKLVDRGVAMSNVI